MDRKIKKKKWTVKRISGIAGITAVLSLVIYSFIFADKRSKVNVDINKTTVASVKRDTFQEFIPRNGIVQPIKTFYIDAIESGIVKTVVRESGVMVRPGDTVMVLSNASLELSVMQQENSLYGQINTARRTRVELETRTLNLLDQLAQIDYQIQLWEPQYHRLKELADKKMVSYREFEQVKEQYEYNIKRRKIMYQSFQKDSMSVAMQLLDLELQQNRMEESLEAVGNILNNLIIRAPVSGQLSTNELQIGESITTGQRIGQVDLIDRFKIRVRIDELYLPRIDIGQSGTFDFAGGTYNIVITKIYPTVTDGTFEVDMNFTSEQPEGLKRGQSVRIKLELGSSAVATLLPVGGFYSSTGGNWVFVLNEETMTAARRDIRIGRKNPEYFEVIEGLEPGEKVITSSYEHFGDNEVLVF